MATPGNTGVRKVLILCDCTLLQLCFGTVYAWSFFQTLLVQQLAWSYTETAIAFSIAIFCLGMSAAWAGGALPKFGPRRLALMGSAMFSGGYLISGFALHQGNVGLFFLGYGVIGGAGIGLGYVTPVATAVKWFPERKGLAAGVVVMGFGVGAFLLSKVLAPMLVLHTEGDLPLLFIWLGIVFACILLPCSLVLNNPPADPSAKPSRSSGSTEPPEDESVGRYLRTPQFVTMWLVFFFNIAAGISVISFQSSLLQDVWSRADPTIEPAELTQYGASLIAISSLFNGVGRLFWGLLSDRIGRVRVFRILLASQMVVFGRLMTESNPWVFCVLVCYILLCFGGGFATMPSFILDVFGPRRMSVLYGAVLTAWAAAGIFGPLYVGSLKDRYPDRAVIYCFLIGVVLLGLGYVFSYLLNDERIRLARPTLDGTLRRFGIPTPRSA